MAAVLKLEDVTAGKLEPSHGDMRLIAFSNVTLAIPPAIQTSTLIWPVGETAGLGGAVVGAEVVGADVGAEVVGANVGAKVVGAMVGAIVGGRTIFIISFL